MIRWRKFVWVAATLALSACGSDGEDASSEGPERPNDGPSPGNASGECSARHCEAPQVYTCFEWDVDDKEHVQLCGQFGGKVAAGACPDKNKVEGCKAASPFSEQGCVINWGYAPAVAKDDLRADCEDREGEIVR